MDLSTRRLTALFVAGLVLLFSPLVGALNRPESFLGLPLLPVYIFGCWGALVLGAWLLTRSGPQ